MIISEIKKTIETDQVVMSGIVKSETEGKAHLIYFKFPVEYSSVIATDYTPFLASFLIPAMKLGEDIHVKGKVSLKFLDNAKKIMDLFISWQVGFKKIKIVSDSTFSDTQNPKNRACFFSLGVDSFYTFLKHKNTKTPINNLILVHGFDIKLENRDHYTNTFKMLEKIAIIENIRPLSVVTNVKDITDKYSEWDWVHGGTMATIALFLRHSIKDVYFAGSDSWIQRKKEIPYGTHPKLDPLWSTEKLKVIHDGNEATRFQKIENVISKSPLALEYLRVCNQNLKGIYNCSYCEKCIRTMIDLKICGVLGKAKTFKDEIPLNKLEKIYNEDKIFFEDSLKELQQRNLYPELQSSIEKSLYKSTHPPLKIKVIKFLAHIDKKFNKKRVINFIFKSTNEGDRNIIFKFFSRNSIIR